MAESDKHSKIIKRKDAYIERLKARNDMLQEAYNKLKHKRVVTHVEGDYISRIEQLIDEKGEVIEEERAEVLGEKKEPHIIMIKSIDHGFWWENYYYINELGEQYGELLCGIIIKSTGKRYFTTVSHDLMKRKRSGMMSVSNHMGYMGTRRAKYTKWKVNWKKEHGKRT